jgi:hypothetical protein
MSGEILVFWRHANGTRCVVAKAQPHSWQLLVIDGDRHLLVEDYEDAHQLLARALELRPLFGSAVA